MKLLELINENEDEQISLNLRKAKAVYSVHKKGFVSIAPYYKPPIEYKLEDVSYSNQKISANNQLWTLVKIGKVNIFMDDQSYYYQLMDCWNKQLIGKEEPWEKDKLMMFLYKIMKEIGQKFIEHDVMTDIRFSFSSHDLQMYQLHYKPSIVVP